VPWLRGKYAKRRVAVPVRWVTGLDDPVITPTVHRGYEEAMPDCEFEKVLNIGRWILEQAPELALHRLRTFMKL